MAGSALNPWDFSCPDWGERLRAGKAPARLTGHPLNTKRSAKAVAIWNNLKLPDVAGQPRLAEAGGDWFRQIVRVAAGGLDSSGEQHVRDVLVSVSKKNAKTSYSAALLLTLMLISPRPRAEFLLVAPTHEIAMIAFKQASGMVYADAHLGKRLHVREHLKTIVDRESGCSLRVVSFDMNVATGSKASVVLLDEAHLLTHEDAPRVIGQLRGSQAAIGEGQMITISTQSDTEARGYWRHELTKARSVRDGDLRLSGYCPIIFEFPPQMVRDGGWKDPRRWKLVNPNLGRSVSPEWLKRAYAEAEAAGPGEFARWCSQHLNLENDGGAIHADDRWPGAYLWPEAAGGEDLRTIDDVIAVSDTITCGIDGGGLDDLLALTVLGRDDALDTWFTWTRCWCTPTVLERRQSISGLLRDFEADGDLHIAQPGDDILELANLVAGLYQTGRLTRIGIDPWGIGVEIAQAIEGFGVPRDLIVGVAQGFKLLPAYKGLERRLDQGRLRHCGQPIMQWSARNARRNERGQITKATAGTGKIDALVALACASMAMIEGPPAWDVSAVIG